MKTIKSVDFPAVDCYWKHYVWRLESILCLDVSSRGGGRHLAGLVGCSTDHSRVPAVCVSLNCKHLHLRWTLSFCYTVTYVFTSALHDCRRSVDIGLPPPSAAQRKVLLFLQKWRLQRLLAASCDVYSDFLAASCDVYSDFSLLHVTSTLVWR